MDAPQQIALDFWKSTLEAHDRQWGNYFVLLFGILAFLATAPAKLTQTKLLKWSILLGVLFFMIVSAITMWENLVIHNDAVDAIKENPGFINSPAIRSMGKMDPWKNTAIHIIADVGLLAIIIASLFPELIQLLIRVFPCDDPTPLPPPP